MYTTEAVVLQSRTFNEADELVSFYTKEFGKLVIKAKGAKKLTTKQGNFLHELAVVRISFILGHKFYILSGINNVRTHPEISKNLLARGYVDGFFLLCDKLFYENHKDDAVWEVLNKVFEDTEELLKSKEDANALWHFEKSWILSTLSILGLMPEKLEIENIKSKKQLDYYINRLLEDKIKHFGLHISYKNGV